MNETVHFLAHHGYWLLVAAIVGRQACLPVPANLVLVAAGALAHSGELSFAAAIGLSIMTFLSADLAWYQAGRRFGDRPLHFFCGLSRDPNACVQRARARFSRHGVRTLMVAKFVGLDVVAAPLSGTARIPLIQFFTFDAIGAALWSGAYASLGYAFSNQLDRVAVHLARMGIVIALLLVSVLGFYSIKRLIHWRHFVRQFKLVRITPEQLKDKLTAGEDVLLVDLQGHRNSGAVPLAIPGAVRIDPHKLERYTDVEISSSQEVILYCAGPGEFTSARVALALQQRGIEHVRPLAGGLQGWCDRGFPITSEVRYPMRPMVRS